MKKVAAAFVSIGVIIVIVGLVLVGIYGRDKIKDGGIFVFGVPNFDEANCVEEKQPDELEDLHKITVNVSYYNVYVFSSKTDVLFVKYIDQIDDGADLSVDYSNGELKITQTGNKTFWGFNWLFNSRYIAVYVPQTALFKSSQLTVTADAGAIKAENIACALLTVETQAGSVNIDNLTANEVNVNTQAGSVNADDIECGVLTITTSAGSVNIEDINASSVNINTGVGSVNAKEIDATSSAEIRTGAGSSRCEISTPTLTITSGAGSIKFETDASAIKLTSGAGSIRGTVNGDQSQYEIKVRNDVGSTNIHNQHVVGATKSLTVESDVGSIKIDFDND